MRGDLSASGLLDSSSPNDDSVTRPPLACSTPCSTRVPFQDRVNLPAISRQAQRGRLIRKQNNKVKSTEIFDLKAALASSEKENLPKGVKIADLNKEVKMMTLKKN